jgi:pimeloyl-ACP methyl ester carboxylesterase
MTIDPITAPLNTPVKIVLQGLVPQEEVSLVATLVDEKNRTWASRTNFVADGSGMIDVSRQSPKSGSYILPDPMGFLSYMSLNIEEKDQSAFWQTTLDPISVHITIERNVDRNIEGNLTRQVINPDVKKLVIAEQGMTGNFFVPKSKGPLPALIVLGGFEGGFPSDAFVAQFANQGYAAFGLAYYNTYGTPNRFSKIPLEYFQQAIKWISSRPEVDATKIGIVGESFGALTALLVASQNPVFKGVVALNGSGIVFQAMPDRYDRSSNPTFTLNGNPYPFLPLSTSTTPNNNYFAQIFLNSVFNANDQNLKQALIPVEKINAPILMLAGLDDRLMGSALLSGYAYNRLIDSNYIYPFELVIYNGVGHVIGGGGLPYTPATVLVDTIEPRSSIVFALGGTIRETVRAQPLTWKKIIEFLDKTVKNATGSPPPQYIPNQQTSYRQ